MRGAWREPDGTRLDDHLHARLRHRPMGLIRED